MSSTSAVQFSGEFPTRASLRAEYDGLLATMNNACQGLYYTLQPDDIEMIISHAAHDAPIMYRLRKPIVWLIHNAYQQVNRRIHCAVESCNPLVKPGTEFSFPKYLDEQRLGGIVAFNLIHKLRMLTLIQGINFPSGLVLDPNVDVDESPLHIAGTSKDVALRTEEFQQQGWALLDSLATLVNLYRNDLSYCVENILSIGTRDLINATSTLPPPLPVNPLRTLFKGSDGFYSSRYNVPGEEDWYADDKKLNQDQQISSTTSGDEHRQDDSTFRSVVSILFNYLICFALILLYIKVDRPPTPFTSTQRQWSDKQEWPEASTSFVPEPPMLGHPIVPVYTYDASGNPSRELHTDEAWLDSVLTSDLPKNEILDTIDAGFAEPTSPIRFANTDEDTTTWVQFDEPTLQDTSSAPTIPRNAFQMDDLVAVTDEVVQETGLNANDPAPALVPLPPSEESFFTESTLPSIRSVPDVPHSPTFDDVSRENDWHPNEGLDSDFSYHFRLWQADHNPDARIDAWYESVRDSMRPVAAVAKQEPAGYGSDLPGESAHESSIKAERSYALILHPIWSSQAQNKLVRYSRFNPKHPYHDQTFKDTRAPPNSQSSTPSFVTAPEVPAILVEGASTSSASNTSDDSNHSSWPPHTPPPPSSTIAESGNSNEEYADELSSRSSEDIMDYIGEQDEVEMEQRWSVQLLRAREAASN